MRRKVSEKCGFETKSRVFHRFHILVDTSLTGGQDVQQPIVKLSMDVEKKCDNEMEVDEEVSRHNICITSRRVSLTHMVLSWCIHDLH